MKLKSFDLIKDDYSRVSNTDLRFKRRLAHLEEFDPLRLLALCLAAPYDEMESAMLDARIKFGADSELDMTLIECDNAVSTLVMPYIKFLMKDYDSKDVMGAWYALILFLAYGAIPESEWTLTEQERMTRIEAALGFVR
jgi:hypothetical protein